MKIGRHEVGRGNPTYIIFEVASTHAGDYEAASAYVEQAAGAGADAVKFQLFEPDKLLLPLTPGLKVTYDFFEASQTPREWYPKLKALCDKAGIDLLCTPFDLESATFLNDVGLPAMKIASGDLTNIPLLRHVARFGKPVILSTGMATMEEVKSAAQTLRASGAQDIVILQCVSVYPTSFEDANVRVVETLEREFNTPVGYSDNGSRGDLVPLMSVALGASVIEKHVTSKKDRGDIDDVFSMDLEEFSAMVKKVRDIESRDKDAVLSELKRKWGEDFDKALGDGIKQPAPHGSTVERGGSTYVMREEDERRWARRGVYLKAPVQKGQTVTEDMLIALRPNIGISVAQFDEVIGKVAGEDLPARVPLTLHLGELFCYTGAVK